MLIQWTISQNRGKGGASARHEGRLDRSGPVPVYQGGKRLAILLDVKPVRQQAGQIEFLLLDQLEDARAKIPLLRPQEDAEHRSLVEILMKTYNNLGVTLQKLSESPRNLEKETDALVNLTRSSEYFDILSRDPETMERGETKNLAFLNMRGILYPQADFLPQIYMRIPKDSSAVQF